MKKTVLVTGIARGIGKAIAETFLKNDYIVHGTFFESESEAMQLKSKYGDHNLILHGPYDFRNLNETEKLIKELSKYKFDSIVPCAGMFSENDDFLNFDLRDFNEIMNCNFYSPLIITIGMQKNINEGGSIIIVSSNDAYSGAFSSISYTISKSALISLTKCLSVNYGAKFVRVNSIAPGAIDTDMNTKEQMELSPQYTPIKRVGTSQEVADAVMYLSSEKSSFINGTNITIDGGYCNVSVLLKSEADSLRNISE